ncbi:MAG: hypothetical protein GXY61_12315 [Lentisphaerae bacterium]|nr:hypothetical protein [Lentisphaerota bacterium]
MVARLWWNLPGPSRFLDLVDKDLNSGKNVVLAFPVTGPAGFCEALAAKVSRREIFRWRKINLTSDDHMDPYDVINDRFRISDSKIGAVPAMEVALCRPLEATIIWVDGIDSLKWAAWRKFILDYEQASRNTKWDRPLFCVNLIGNSIAHLPANGVALSIRKWNGFVDRMDLMLFLAGLSTNGGSDSCHQHLASAITVELAGNDVELALELSRTDLKTLMSPLSLLQNIANKRGWDEKALKTPDWVSGILEVFNGKERLNSAAAAAALDKTEINRRLWKAEVVVLFPFLEDLRIKLLTSLRRHLHLPLTTPFGIITDPFDLEIGHILHLIRNGPVPRETKHQLAKLNNMRRAIAHIKPVEWDDINIIEARNG